MHDRRLAFGLIMVMMIQIIVPVIPVDATMGRTTPDFTVSVMTLSAGGSVDDGIDTILAPGDHVIRIVVTNQGPVDGSATLNLVHQPSPASAESSFTSINLGVIAATSSSNPILINWTATSGDDQTLFARISSATDINPSNDERRLDFHVRDFHYGVVLTDTVPGPTGGFSDVRLNHTTHTFDATVRNDGVMPVSAVFELNFTDALDPNNQMSFWGNTETLQPGNLLYQAGGVELSTSFDASLLLGSWTLATKVHFNGTLWNNVIVSSVEIVTFSDYIIDVSPPGDRAIEPGATTVLTWIITNLGIADSLQIELGSDQGWHDDSQEGTIINIPAGESTTVVVQVAIPSNAVKPTLENVYLNLTSQGPDAYTARSVGHVMVGDQFQATVTAPLGPVTVTPAQTEDLLFTVENSGNVPSAFIINTGLSAAAENWDVVSLVSETEVMPAGTNVTITVKITPAPISSPLDPGERNAAGDSIYAWLQATPAEGGIPSLNSTQLIIRPVIAVDPGPETEMIYLTEQQVLEANGSGGIDEILSLQVEVRHNLGAAVTGGVDANLTVGSSVFTPINSGGNNEAVRWGTTITPDSVSALQIGEIFQSWLGIDGPGDELPLAGTLVLPVTATPILTAGQQANGVLASSVTRNISIIIPSIIDGAILTEGPLDADVGNETNFTIDLANTGNDLSSYRLSIVDDLPDDWSATLDTLESGNPSIISNLSPSMADHPVTGNAHIKSFNLSITTDPQAPADTFQPLNISIEDRLTGEILEIHTLMIRVQESVNFELHPTNDTVDLSLYETPLTRVYINNTGNVATTFTLWLDESQAGEIDFVIESAMEVLVAPGYSESIKLRLNPNPDASADDFHMATLWVMAQSGMNLSASIVGNISGDHHLLIDGPSSVEVTPGINEVIPFTFTNNGNLEEYLNVTAVIEGNWSSSWVLDQIVLPINGSLGNDLTVNVPALGGEQELANGDIHNLTVTLYQTSTGAYLVSRNIQLVVAPLFLVEVEDWPDDMYFHRNWDRDWKVSITNVGNEDVVVNLSWDILKPGLPVPSSAWEMASGAPTALVLPRGVSVELSFTVEAKEFEPDINLQALLRVSLTPVNEDVSGTSVLETNLKMSRLFTYGDFPLQPSQDDSNLTQEIIWSHIPEGTDTTAAYMIELCDASRIVNLSALGLSEENYSWNFALNTGDSVPEFNLANDCDSGGSHQAITLPARASWVTDNPLLVVIDTPDRPNILQNDGYDLTFRLYHPDDHSGFTVYTEATFRFFFDTYSEPVIEDLKFADGELMEGATTKVTATLRNTGTSIAVNVQAVLTCDGITVAEPVIYRSLLLSSEAEEIEWFVTSDHLDWWIQGRDVECSAKLIAQNWDGELIENEPVLLSGEVESWSPGITISFIAVIALILASVGLLRLVGQSEKFRLAAVYSGVLALGFAFHLVNITWWGPLILVLAACWVWRMTWRSTEEFQLIHEDYQRARKGISTLYSDHFDVLNDAKRQLSIILAMPILGMVIVILGIPPQMSPDANNLSSLIGYIALVILGVWFLIWKANKLYGGLYGRLTDVEVKATRIERDLGDPARLLTELARDGIDLSSIISTPRPTIQADGEASTDEVNAWDEDMDVLLESDEETEAEVEPKTDSEEEEVSDDD
jgi:uncharacterized membrane protein